MSGNSRAEKSTRPRGGAASAWPAFLIAHDTLVACIEETLKAAGLPEISWYTVLWVLERSPNRRLRMAELAEAAVIPRSNLTRLIDRMETAGLVSRERVSGDRRGAYACLTKEGQEMKARIWEVYGPAIKSEFTTHLTKDENTFLREIMERLISAANQE